MAGKAQILPNAPKPTAPNSRKVFEIRSITLFLCAFCAFLWPKNPSNQRKPRLKVRPKGLHSFAFYILIFTFSLTSYGISSTKDYVRKNKLFMQNKANFRKVKFSANDYITMDYAKRALGERGKNKANSKPIQSQSKPIQTQFQPKKCQNKPNSNPNKANFERGRLLINQCQNHSNILPI